jgi:hypothetical protein
MDRMDIEGEAAMLKHFIGRLVEPYVARRVRQAIAETENTITVGWRSLASERDRADYDREQVLEAALDAWRTNPLARRIVELTTQYVVGGGLRIRCEDEEAARFLAEWWDHPLNRLPQRLYEWCDELSRAGELFLLLTSDAGGMSYVRAVPAAQIYAVQTAENDVQQELTYRQRGDAPGEESAWPAYDAQNDPMAAEGGFQPAMLHYTVNRPVGAVRGESDLAPMLRWLSRYSGWLEDRARLNRFRNTFVFTVKARFASESERLARQAALAANPPGPGSILVTDESEEWGVLSPKLESQEAGEDGLALKKMIAAGAGIPMHFLAEPESATRTTAEAAGGPAYRRLEQRQQYFCWLVGDVARAAVRRWGLARGRAVDADVRVDGADLSARDNASLAAATAAISAALMPLWERGLLKEEELLRLVYRFAGETANS